jgi:GAF domain-containing protein
MTAGLARVSAEAELDASLPLFADELNADFVRLDRNARSRSTRQTLVSDSTVPAEERAALRETGYGARLTTPIHRGDQVVGMLELYSHQERPWSRFHISRARLIAHQLGAVLDRAQPRSSGARG